MRMFNVVLIYIFLIPIVSYAHRVNMAYRAEGNGLIVKTWMGEDEPAAGGEFTIIAEDGNILATGEADKNGLFRWEPPTIQSLTIKVYAGRGHQGEISISKEELEEMFAGSKKTDVSKQQEDQVQETESAEMKQAETQKESASKTSDHSQSATFRSTENAFGAPERIIMGMIFLFAAAAAWLAYRNSRKLAVLEEYIKNRES